jgi:putative colanic acid biosynthesis acetyltransferase WcaF
MTYIARRARFCNPANITIGGNCVIDNCFFYALDRIDVGDRTIIGQSVFLCTGSHDLDADNFHLVTKPITIGSYVWIATGATILPGVNIGDGAVIGAMAVVSRDVPAGAVVAGNPARVVRTGRAAPEGFDPLSLASLDVGVSIRRLRQALWSERELKSERWE